MLGTRIRTAVITTAALAATLGLATSAMAVTGTIGNPATNRATVDTYANFTIVDTNHPAAFDGVFTSINFYAEQAGTVRFVVVDPSAKVTWVSDPITAGAAGLQTATFDDPVGITMGSNLAVYSQGFGVVSFDYADAATAAEYTNNNAGLPVVGNTLTYAGASARYYSMNANITATSPDICKNGGWVGLGYKNQGQCIASIVANANAGKL